MAEPDVSAEKCRAQAVAWFLSSEKTIAEIAHTLNLSESTVRQWVWNATPEQLSDDVGPADPGTDAARPEASTTQAQHALTDAALREAVRRAETMAAEAIARAEASAAEAKAEIADPGPGSKRFGPNSRLPAPRSPPV